jgi:hypothetical protein
MLSTPQSLPTSQELLNLTIPFPGTRTRAGPPACVVTRTAACVVSPQMTVVPGAKSRRPPFVIRTMPYVPAARSQRPFPGITSPTLQS